MENINYLWLSSIYDILVHKQNKYHVKNYFISASSFCVVMKKAESVSTVLSLPYFIQPRDCRIMYAHAAGLVNIRSVFHAMHLEKASH